MIASCPSSCACAYVLRGGAQLAELFHGRIVRPRRQPLKDRSIRGGETRGGMRSRRRREQDDPEKKRLFHNYML